MKLVVLAQTPPPLHGQSAMIQALVNGLPAHGIEVHHVNLRLSRDAADIGRWSLGKIFAALRCATQALLARFAHDCDTLYYVPAPPGKRGALYRDWVVMLLCRPFFPRCVLHWHAAGLGGWLQNGATPLERAVTSRLLGRVDLAIVLAESLRPDAEKLKPRTIACVPNGIPDPGPPTPPGQAPPFRLLFLGLGSEEKGLFAAAAAVLAANVEVAAPDRAPAFVLTAAGPFPDEETAARFARLCREHPDVLRHVGSVDATARTRLFQDAHALLFPTRYTAEGMPLVALEALAHDRPIVATRWRALPDIVTPDVGLLVSPDTPRALVTAVRQLRDRMPPAGVCRARFDERFTLEHHLTALAAALAQRDSAPPQR